MFAFFFRTRRTKSKVKTANRRRLSVEQLETRDCPSVSVGADLLSGNQVEIMGTVAGAGAADAVIDFNGAITGSTTADANGNFSYTTTSAAPGTVSVVALNSQQATLGTASAAIPASPDITLGLSYLSQQTVMLSGNVTGVNPASETVTFSGEVSGSTVTDANGNFSYIGNIAGVGAIDAVTTDSFGRASNTAQVGVTAAPIVTLSTHVFAGHAVELTGTVSGAYAAGATVTFSGAITGSVTADANGNFTYMTKSASLGVVSAVASDSQQHTSFPVYATIADAAPTITLAVTASNENTVTLAGKVTDVDAAGEIVSISGALNGTVAADANGNFSLTLATSDLATVAVNTTDQWGETSNTAEVTANSFPPVITSFTAIQGSGNAWILEGTVVAPNMQGLVITFGGLPALVGQTVAVAADGTFYLVQNLGNDYGTATAQATNPGGQTSNIATAIIS